MLTQAPFSRKSTICATSSKNFSAIMSASSARTCFCFHDTIWENIRYGRLDATKEEILEAARKAHVDFFVQEFHKGYQTIIGDSGSKLSGSHKQRISIARTIPRGSPIPLSDEATSALDTESECITQNALHELAEGRTVIAIAHRLSTVLAAHKIILMKDGKVEAGGSNESLLASCRLYQKLHRLQFNTETYVFVSV
jgi:ABC-type multidrug transport system fused ATPase/permease subunit